MVTESDAIAAERHVLSPGALILRSELLGPHTLVAPSSGKALEAAMGARQTSELPPQPSPGRARVRRRVAPPALSPARGILAYHSSPTRSIDGAGPVSPLVSARARRRGSRLGAAASAAPATLATPPSTEYAPSAAAFSASAASPALSATRAAAAAVPGSPGTRLATVEAVRSHALGSLNPLSRAVLASPQPGWRTIGKVPYKVLDAPSLRDDFYLSLVDWGAKGLLAVGLGDDVFLWNSKTAAVTRLMEIRDGVAAVSWSESGALLAVSSSNGEVQVWDAEAGKQVSRHQLARDRVSTLAWANSVLAAGSRNNSISLLDVSMRRTAFSLPQAHSSEVCGLRFSPDRATLASGGNDNKVRLWSLAGAMRDVDAFPRRKTLPLYTLQGHTSAVRALDWSPHRRGLLASGGGSMDKCIRFWDTLSGVCVGCVDTKCQVCNVRWSLSREELVSSHGYSHNDVVVWRYPSMSRIATLQGHKTRVLFLTMDPSGENVVTGAGDETLRFWRVFPKMTAEQAAARPENWLPTAKAGAPAGSGADTVVPFHIAAAASAHGSMGGEMFR